MSIKHRCPWCGERAISRKEAFRSIVAFRPDIRYRLIEHIYHCPQCNKPVRMFSNLKPLMLILVFPVVILLVYIALLKADILPLISGMFGIPESFPWGVVGGVCLILIGVIAVIMLVSILFFGSFSRLEMENDAFKQHRVSPIPVQLIIEAERRIPLCCEKVLVVQLPLTPAQIYKKAPERHRELTAFFEPSARPTAKGKHAYDVGFLFGNEINLDHIAVGMPITVVLRDGETTVDATVRVVRR